MELEDLSHERRRMHGRLLLRFAVIVAQRQFWRRCLAL